MKLSSLADYIIDSDYFLSLIIKNNRNRFGRFKIANLFYRIL
jgi:hypothetical protein